MPNIRSLCMAGLAAGALAVPATASACPPAMNVSAALSASARADLAVHQLAQVASDAGASAEGHLAVLLASGRRAWHAAIRGAEALDVQARTSVQVHVAAHADTRLSERLAEDSRLLAKVAVETGGRIQSGVASALRQDIAMQARIVRATLGLAEVHAGLAAKAAVSAAAEEESSSVIEVRAASNAAGSVDLTGKARATADLAVGLGIDAITATAHRLRALEADASSRIAADAGALVRVLSHGAAQVSSTVGDDGIGDATVRIDGRGAVSLGSLAQASLEATGSISAGLSAGGSASGSDCSGSDGPSGSDSSSGSGDVSASGTASGSGSASGSALLGILG